MKIHQITIVGAEVVKDDPGLIRYDLIDPEGNRQQCVTPRTSKLGKIILSEIEATVHWQDLSTTSVTGYSSRVPVSQNCDLSGPLG